jgi:5-methyltetrahydropteroyltriglutamate--homocysteine methyltransferase
MIKTTVIGSFPKPTYLKIPTWFAGKTGRLTTSYNVKDYSNYYQQIPDDHEQCLYRATKEIIELQDNLGIDILTDGEIKRENYINYHLRFLDGVDFDNLTEVASRNNAYRHQAPTVVGPVRAKDNFLSKDWKLAKQFTKKHLKVTLPGPMTIADTVANSYYKDKLDLLHDFAKAINFEILDLVKSGCKHIQVDEPLFARNPEFALKYGIKILESCFANVPADVSRIVHICCGYPDKLNGTDYPKAALDSYFKISEALDNSEIDVISLEDAHRNNSLELFKKFQKKAIILGIVNISSTEVETVQQIEGRLQQALRYLKPENLYVGPDCGLAMLPLDIAIKKLKNMVEATKLVNSQ